MLLFAFASCYNLFFLTYACGSLLTTFQVYLSWDLLVWAGAADQEAGLIWHNCLLSPFPTANLMLFHEEISCI
jgi:hypothetical protein